LFCIFLFDGVKLELGQANLKMKNKVSASWFLFLVVIVYAILLLWMNLAFKVP
jgi:hypothetical protein